MNHCTEVRLGLVGARMVQDTHLEQVMMSELQLSAYGMTLYQKTQIPE